VITGATGYIGSQLIQRIVMEDKSPNIIVLVRNLDKARETLPSFINFIQLDLTDTNAMASLQLECDYIIHCATVTNSSEMIAHPVEVTQSIINTTQNVLELARRCSIKSMVYLSSMEVYGDINCSYGSRVSETELGNIDILNTRSCYPLGKRMAENICYSYYKEYGIPVKIARLAQTFGRGILPTDNRVFAQFARAARDGKNIVLNTKGNSMGNYCGMEDAIAGIMTILVHGTDGEAYNVVNEVNTMTIRQMAELVCNEISGGKIVVEYDIPKENPLGFAPDTGLRLSGQKLEALGWKPRKHLLDMYKDLIADMR
jgi:nucleoside-diphosphate-sugar epimerase